jgi:hypothetical protein
VAEGTAMSTYETITGVTSIGALLAVFASIWMLRRQLIIMERQNRQLDTSLELSTSASLDELYMVATQAFLAHPDLRALFHEDEAAPTRLDRETRLRANALAETIADGMEQTLELERVGMSGVTESLQAWTIDSLRYSEFLRTWINTHQRWHSDRLLKLLAEVESNLENEGPSR